jgi:hypothetical protein
MIKTSINVSSNTVTLNKQTQIKIPGFNAIEKAIPEDRGKLINMKHGKIIS